MTDLAATDLEEVRPVSAPKVYTRTTTLIVTTLGVIACIVAARWRSFGIEPARVQTTSETIKLVQCQAPMEDFRLEHKGCPKSASGTNGCVAHNQNFNTFAEAWGACGQDPECGAIMKWTDDTFYLRRASDPEFPIAHAHAMLFSCPEEVEEPNTIVDNDNEGDDDAESSGAPPVWKVTDNVVMIGGGDEVEDRYGKIVGIMLVKDMIQYNIEFDDGLDPSSGWYVTGDFEMPGEGDGFAPGKDGGRGHTGGHTGLKSGRR